MQTWLSSGLGAEATPTTVFLDANGDYITRLPGFVDAGEFLHILRYIGSKSFKVESYKDFRSRQVIPAMDH
jgi:thioredoxin-related protein